ncbi:UDP-N-acetylglucosamine 2-epimerase [Haladaptatus sp. T7]|uniref:UDP-N-acetyl glucosamine 2-epimerase n=1 Tax=Haladaptatus sp. T7 TaxID=2029368 RepID=UPI0021A25672|nr:UDP-N-acetylglucosamine 2-epimerase [Haladaptatus sp. T7]GKZ15647.1 UDP-N-acetyl glucosamine 2-epimerase [Haladaptatus sp. T7]
MDVEIHDDRLARQMEGEDFVLAVVTATKPDFYKQAPVVAAARERGVPCFVLHTGQHYDDLLGHGLDEYDLAEHIAVDLNVRGGLSQKSAELLTRIESVADALAASYPDTTVLPVVHGDTLAAGIVPQAWLFATNSGVAHNEAGLRSMAPPFERYGTPAEFVEEQWNADWELNRTEPFPEQYDTFVGSAAATYHLAPTALNRDHLVREGYPEEVHGRERIPVVGNSVVDAIEMKKGGDGESVFDVYPILERRDDWIRVDVHRRANLLPDRFRAIVNAVIGLVEAGYNVNFVELNATKTALENYGLREKLLRLDDDHDNFFFSGLWKRHAHVYEFLESGQCFAELTDSGSMQEELNHIEEAVCLTARFNTDRPETVFEANSNLLVPPISGEFMQGMVEHVHGNDSLRERMRSGPSLYGEDVGDEIVSFLWDRRDEDPFEWAHERAGFDAGRREFDYL